MSNTDRLCSGLGLPMSDRLVVTRPVGQRAPITSPQPSIAHPSQWIPSLTMRYTQQGAAFHHLNSVHHKASAPPASQHIVYYTRYYGTPPSSITYKTLPPTDTAHHHAPLRASGRSHPTPTNNKPMSHPTWSCAVCRKHTPTTSIILLTHTHNLHNPYIVYYQSTTTSMPSNLPECYKQVLLKDRHAPQFSAEPSPTQPYITHSYSNSHTLTLLLILSFSLTHTLILSLKHTPLTIHHSTPLLHLW
jgi:hypothetical protein